MPLGEFQPWAAAIVTGATGVSITNRNCVTARTGAGVYTLTLGQDLDSTEAAYSANPRNAAARILQVIDTSDTVKTVTAFDAAGAAADTDFDVVVYRIAPP